MTAERIVEALASAELIEVLKPDSQAVDAKTRTDGDLNGFAKPLAWVPSLS